MNAGTQTLSAAIADPVRFAREVLGLGPWSRQEEILRLIERHPRVAVAGGHGVGKGYLAASAMLWFLFSRPGSIVISTAPTSRQVNKLLWGEIRRMHAASRVPLGGRMLQTELRLGPRWYAFGFSTDETDRFQGFHAGSLMVVIDEAAGVDDAIHEAADAVLSGGDTRLLLIGNPTARSGRFHRAFEDRSFVTATIPCHDHPNVIEGREVVSGAVTRGWIEMVRSTYGEDSAYYRSRVLARFPEERANSLLKAEWIEAALTRQAGEAGEPRERSLGVDIARFGPDSTVLVAAEGGRVLEIVSVRKTDLVEVASLIQRVSAKWGVDPARVAVDDTGLGGGVTDLLRSRGLAVRAERFGSRAFRSETFQSRASELLFRLRSLLESGRAALGGVAMSEDGRILAEQLALLAVEYAPDGRIRVSGQPGELARPSTSPDHAVALALAMGVGVSGM